MIEMIQAMPWGFWLFLATAVTLIAYGIGWANGESSALARWRAANAELQKAQEKQSLYARIEDLEERLNDLEDAD